MEKPNEAKLTVSDVIAHLGKELEKDHDVKLSNGKLKDVFIEAILRNIVLNEIADMMLFVVDESKWDAVMTRRG